MSARKVTQWIVRNEFQVCPCCGEGLKIGQFVWKLSDKRVVHAACGRVAVS